MPFCNDLIMDLNMNKLDSFNFFLNIKCSGKLKFNNQRKMFFFKKKKNLRLDSGNIFNAFGCQNKKVSKFSNNYILFRIAVLWGILFLFCI